VRPLGGKWRPSVGKVREWHVKRWHLQGYSPCLCRLRTDGLAPVSKYWTYRSHTGVMGPISLVVCRQQRVTLPPLLQWLDQERNWVWTHGSDGRCAVDCVASPFSQQQWLYSSLLMTAWRVAICGPCKICMVVDHMRTEHGSVWRVHQVFTVECTSIRIATTLGYE
jgi:hypothetical protein